MESGDEKRVILITSKYHTRRVKTIWRAIGASQFAVVRYTKDDPFNAARWWLNTGDAMSVARETFEILKCVGRVLGQIRALVIQAMSFGAPLCLAPQWRSSVMVFCL